jgi:hypothetical protein
MLSCESVQLPGSSSSMPSVGPTETDGRFEYVLMLTYDLTLFTTSASPILL